MNMRQKIKQHNRADGFTLPTVLMIGIALLIIGLSMFQTVSSVRKSIDDQYYGRLATEAAQSGVAYGNYCFVGNNYKQSWGPAAGKPNLTQSTDCTGAASTNAVASLLSTDTLNITFTVGDTVGRPDGATLITGTGTVKRLQVGSGQVIATYTKTVKRVTRASDFKQGQQIYGYYRTCDASGAFFATLQFDGSYRAAGGNTYGQLGNGLTSSTLTPTIYQLPTGKTAARAFTNTLSQGCQLYVVTTEGELYGAGWNKYGQIGNNTTSTSVATPAKAQIPAGEKAVYVGVGGQATFVITDANNVYAMGSCEDYMLGIGTSCNSGSYKRVPTRVSLPTPNSTNLNTIPAQEIVIDSSTVYIRMQGGAVYGWGGNNWGQLANNSTNNVSTPIKIGTFGDSGKPKAKQIAFDGDTIYIVADDGKAYAAGRNDFGQMGVNTTTSSYKTIQQVQMPSGSGNVIRVTTDQWFASFLTDKGYVYSVGYNGRGQLGNGSTATRVKSPVQFILPTGVTATYMYTTSLGDDGDSPNYDNTYVIGSDYRVYGAGANTFGQIGIGTTSSSVSTPKAMNVIDGISIKASDVLSGGGSAIVITTTGVVYSVGNNDSGQLGNGTTINSSTPIRPAYLQPRAPNYIF